VLCEALIQVSVVYSLRGYVFVRKYAVLTCQTLCLDTAVIPRQSVTHIIGNLFVQGVRFSH
jgi:hypothetical protein